MRHDHGFVAGIAGRKFGFHFPNDIYCPGKGIGGKVQRVVEFLAGPQFRFKTEDQLIAGQPVQIFPYSLKNMFDEKDIYDFQILVFLEIMGGFSGNNEDIPG